MDIEPQHILQTLRKHSKDYFKGPSECHRLLTILNHNLTEEQLNTSVIDLYLIHIFDRSNGLFDFILEIAPEPKFDNSSTKCLEIIYTLINNLSNKIEQFILDTNDNILKVLQCKASAKVKSKALDVLLISFEKVDKCLSNQGKYSAVFEGIRACLLQAIHPESVRQKEFIAVGLFTKRFSYLISDPNSIKNYFIIQLDDQMTRGSSQGSLYGIFTGLTHFCESFPLSLENSEDSAIVGKLYEYIKKLSGAEGKVKYGCRAAINFFGANMNLFMNVVINEYKQWHKRLLNWLQMGFDEKKVGELTLKALLLNVAEALVGMSPSKCMPVLNHFIGWFKSIMKKPNASYTEKKLCVQGLKYFSGPLYKHYTKENAREVFLLIMQNFEKLYVLSDNAENEEWEFLPDYVQCLASFMRYQHFTNSEVYCLQRSVISMIKTFHKLKPLHHSVVIDAFVTTLFYLKETKHFDAFLENAVYQGVVWSCSHKHITDSDLDGPSRIITVKNYFPLWRGSLKLVSNRSYDKISMYFEDRKYILTKIVNELIKTLMILINKLNVDVKLKEDVVQTDIETAYRVEQTSDYAIFLNVVDFYQEIFNNIDPNMLRHCICRMINHIVARCLKYPLVSGFYKLFSFVLKIASYLKLFEKGNIILNQDVANCKETLSKFLACLLHKMKLFKDELLISCLYVLLESPVVVVEPLLQECAGIFVTVFEVGRSYIALANTALSTLQRWQQSMDKDEFGSFLLQVIPCLDSFLRSKSLGGFAQAESIEKKRKTAQALKRRTVLVELEPELVKFQKRVLCFVGSQNSKICQAFVSPEHSFERKVTSDILHLKVALPYNDLTLEVHLEPFITRVIELSLYSSDRKTRVMACELLQAFVMVFLGRTKLMPPSSLSDLDDLLKTMMMPLLQLACDVDQVVRQIFEPLFMQLIHWYTSKTQRGSPHLAVIIEVLMEGITHPTNSSLRDFSGKCISEFVQWTIKQTSEDELKHPTNIKVLVKRMRFFSGHPDLVKKLGAALIFNNIYKEFREERVLISIFSLELLHIFIYSLDSLEYSNEEVDNTVIQITNAVNHLKRIFVEKPQTFRDADVLRRIPSDIPEGNLVGLSKWLLSMTASRSKYCRDICMELFIHLQPLSGTREPLSLFVQKHFDNLVSNYSEQLKKYPTLENSSNDCCTLLLKWLQSLLCFLDGYTFIIKNSLCSVNLNEESNIEAVSYFLKNVQTVTIEQALKQIGKGSSVPYYTAINKEHFLNLKSSCSVAVLKLTIAVLNDEVLCEKTSSFWNQYMWNLIQNFIFNRSSLGFDEKLSQSDYLEILNRFLNITPRKLKEDYSKELVAVLRKYVAENFDVDIDLKRNVNLKQRNTLKGLIMIQNSQLNNIFKAADFSDGLIDKLMNSFLKNIEEDIIYIDRLPEITTEHCSLILKFALNNSKEFSALVSHLYKNVSVSCQEIADIDSQMTFGVYFISKFADPVVKFIVDNFQKFMEGSDNIELIVKLTGCLLKYMESNRAHFYGSFSNVSEGILAKWVLFEMYFEENSIDLGLEFIKQIWRLFGQHLTCNGNIQKWLLSLLIRDEIMPTEQEGVSLYLNIFSVLVGLVDGDDDADALSSALEKLQSVLEPVLISNPGSTTVAEKLLTNLPGVKSEIIFKFLIEFYVTNIPVDKNDIDLSGLLKCFISKNNERRQMMILQAAYLIVMDETKSFEQKKKLADNVLPYIFKYSSYRAFENFFETYIRELMETLENATSCGNKMLCFLLIEILFLRIPIGAAERTACSISEASGNPKLRASLSKLALDAFKNKSEENREHIRLYKCSAYKALASIISNSIRSENFYEKLFLREENHQDILWNELIDTSITYNFPVDFDSYPKKRKVLVNIRDELRLRDDQNSAMSLRYIESQKLFNSSLVEDVTKFDFTTSILRTYSTANRVNCEDDLDGGNVEQDLATKFVEGEVYLEATEVNNHELMGTICGLIEHIFASGICHLPEDPEVMVEFPRWMEGIKKLLLSPQTHRNIKIFWVKVIDNMIHIFKYFAKLFAEPLLQFLTDKIAGTALNYFVSDVVVILASWTRFIQPNEKEAKLASDFLCHMITVLSNERQDTFKYNINLVKLFLENWKGYLEVPFDTLDSKLNFPISDRRAEVGIHLASIFLVNNILPCKESSLETFWNKLMNILGSSVTSIYKPCAETVGLLLKYFKMHQMDEVSFRSSVAKILLSFDDINEINKYARCLEGVAIHYSDIVDNYHVIKMLNRLPQSDPNLQCTFLKIIFKRVDMLNDVDAFKTEDWCKYLESQNQEIQLVTLEIILKTVQVWKEETCFKEILNSVRKNLLNPNIFCRGRMYDILMAILETGDIRDSEVAEMCKEVLIQGLVDADIEIREKIRKFWSENPSIPSAIAGKFPYLMSNFYLPKTEQSFLGYVSYSLLESINSEEYDKELFEHPLDHCEFQDYKLQTNWRLQHPSVVPLFAETLRTYTEGLDDASSSNVAVLRATQDNFTFAPTQQTVRERHISEITSLESSLLGSSVSSSRSDNANFTNPNFVNLSERYKLPKKRFLKDKAKISAGFAHLAVAQKIRKHVKRYDDVKEREKKVTIYRNYRKGDFPDVQITLGSLVKPLQMLVLHDSELSKIFVSVVYKTLKDKLKNHDGDYFIKPVSDSIKRIFTSSVQFNANVFSTLLDILLGSIREIRLDPGLISSVCQQSGLISVGALLIEEYLMSIESEPGSSKRGTYSDDAETRHWLKLAELYKQLHEWNLVRTIFLEKANCKEDVHKAIMLESEKRWREAQEKYQKLLEVEPSIERRDFYCESSFKCLAHLGEWENLPKAVESLVPGSGEKTWDYLWDNDWFQQKILPWYISAQVKNVLFTGNDSPQFLMDINKSLSNPDQAEYLKNKYSEELCILWLTQKDTAQATQYLKTSLENFLNEWQLLNPMFGHLRYNKVLNLRTLIEIDRFLDVERNLAEGSGEESVKSLQDYWKSTEKEFLPSIILSESKLLYRKFFSKLLQDKLGKFNQGQLIKDLKKNNILLDIFFMDLAVEEENFYMTRKYYREYVSLKHPSLTMICGNMAYLYAKLVRNDPERKLAKLLEALRKFREIVESAQDEKVLVSLLKIFDISQKVTDILSNNPELYMKHEVALSEIFGSDTDSPMNVACKSLKNEALKTTSPKDVARDNIVKEKKNALVKLAYFVQDIQDQEQDFVLYVLRAMKLGSREARQLFPCILLKDSLEDKLRELFMSESENIPTWMFLGWIPQLLANADSPKVRAISEIILRIARTYPQAIMYSYRLSKENYSNTMHEFSDHSERLINELDELLLKDPMVDKFLLALSKVNIPIITLEYYMKKMCFSQDNQSVMKIKDHLLDFLFKEDSDSRNSDSMQGNMYKSVKIFRKDIHNISGRPTASIVRAIEAKRKAESSNSKMLKDYCPWLSNFSAGRMNLELEIPGQYTGEKLPLVQHHVKISGFRDNVSVMSSLRRPIKVTMVGMDSKEYPFLVKFGEDIRQDQRIQQLFILMNNIFASDNKNHHVLTYQVIPLTSTLGIIQWVENTVSLNEFIEKSLPSKRKLEAIGRKYFNFFERRDKDIDIYGLTALKKDRNKVIPFYYSVVNEIPLDVLRTSIWSVSLTTEGYIAFKDNFIKSYAAICACHWILGIGDRHLQNFKVCTRNGKVLGIDFGHAFGTATQILSVPELVPMRLTPHLISLMEPLREKGPFRDVMIDCLRSMRENSASLLATMNVFIQEPSIDWLENAKRVGTSDSSDIHQWYPLQKIDQAKRKLLGASSTAILVEDLKSSSVNQLKPEYFKAYISLVEGDETYDLRARLKLKESLSVEEQVDSLIDHAADPNLLGRMFTGWYSFV